jgi:hypothetical protein
MQKDNQVISNNISYKDVAEYKTCALRDCYNKGENHLKIIYIEKSGWFCDNCTRELKKAGFILSEN